MLKIKKNWFFFLPIVLTPIFTGVFKMDIINSVSGTVLATLIIALISFAVSKLTRKTMGMITLYEKEFIRLILWNESKLRWIYSNDIGEKGLIVHVPNDVVIFEAKIKKPINVNMSGFYSDNNIYGGKMEIEIDNFPTSSLIEFQISLSTKNKKSSLLKSGLTICPSIIIPEAINLEFWKPQEVYLSERINDLKKIKIHFACINAKLKIKKANNDFLTRLSSWICGVVAIISELLIIIVTTLLLISNSADEKNLFEFLNWPVSFFILGIWGVIILKDIPFFVKTYIKAEK